MITPTHTERTLMSLPPQKVPRDCQHLLTVWAQRSPCQIAAVRDTHAPDQDSSGGVGNRGFEPRSALKDCRCRKNSAAHTTRNATTPTATATASFITHPDLD